MCYRRSHSSITLGPARKHSLARWDIVYESTLGLRPCHVATAAEGKLATDLGPHLQAKFSAKDPAHFELEDVEAADVGEELDIVAAAEQGSHSHATFKQAYANSATLNMNEIASSEPPPVGELSGPFHFYRVLQGRKP
jgi:hypothetical protein